MKKIENSFAVTGFVAKDAEIRQFTNTSVARFSLNENADSFDVLTKGTLLTVEGYFKPEEWADKDGVLHNRIVMVAVRFYPAVEKEEEPAEPAKTTKKGKK